MEGKLAFPQGIGKTAELQSDGIEFMSVNYLYTKSIKISQIYWNIRIR